MVNARFGVAVLAGVALSVGAQGAVHRARSGAGERIEFTVEGFRTHGESVGGRSFLRMELGGVDGFEGVLFDEGKPEIPALRFFVEGSGSVQVSVGSATPQRLGAPLIPALYSAAKRPGARSRFSWDPASYGSSDAYPPVRYEVQELGIASGVRRRLVSLYPVQYFPADQRVERVENFVVEVGASSQRPWVSKTVALVVPPSFQRSPALARYQSWLRYKGLNPVGVGLRSSGNTPQEIRAALRTLYRDPAAGLGAVILVGDAQEVPGFPSPRLSGVTDHYYRCLDVDDYESDIGAPDVVLGRFSAQSERQLSSMVEKIIRYELQSQKDSSWLNRISLIATDDTAHYQTAEGTFTHVVKEYLGVLGYLGVFPKWGQPGGDHLFAITHKATGTDVMGALRQGRGLVNYSGHGVEDSWQGPEVSQADVESLAHPEATPLVLSNSCDTGKFIGDSFAETWHRHPQGALAYWGSMDSTYWDEDDKLQKRLYESIFKNGERQLSRFMDLGLNEVWRYYGGQGRSRYYWETYILFGDPTVRFRPRS